MTFSDSVHAKAIDLVRRVVEMTTEAGSGHPSSAASIAHVVTVLLYRQMEYEPLQPDHPVADRLVLSEGHACPIVYAAGADLGFAIDGDDGRRAMEAADLHQLRQPGSALEGHPNPRSGFPFFSTATGSLGQGLSMACGLALAARMDAQQKRVYCILGDGESREGQVWEALDFLIDERLRGVCPIFNCNGLGQTGEVSAQQSPAVLQRKLEAFGFDARRIDGHDPDALREAFAAHASLAEDARPIAIVAETTKGWGVPDLQGDMHGKPLPGELAGQALAHLDELATKLGAGADPADLRQREELPKTPSVARSTGPRPVVHTLPTFTEALQNLDRQQLLDEDTMATRKAHGLALQMLGRLRPDVVVLDGDVANSTYTELFAKDDSLADRFLQCRIGEQHMVSCAVGLAAAGKVPLASSFGKFLVRAYDQLEMAMVSEVDLKLVGSHVGVTPAADGPSQMALADVGFCRALATATRSDGRPQLHVLTPCDARSAYGLTMAMFAHPGSHYLRTQRPAVPHLYGDDATFEPGGLNVLVEGKDVAIFAWGYLVHEALAAVRRLEEHGVRATLVDAYSVPMDAERVLEIVIRNGGRVLTVEDNYGAAMGGAVAEIVGAGASARVVSMTVPEVPLSGRDPDEVLRRLGLSRDHIVERARRLVGAA